MTTAPLSLKIFPQDADIRFDGWQNEFRNLIQMFFDGEDLPGVLPDFKGFTKSYNRASWFQPLYEGALARKPLVVRIEAGDQNDFTHGQYSGWQHKIRLAWHSICNGVRTSTQTVLDEPVTVAISTSALPLTVKDTEAYKAIMAKGYMEHENISESVISDKSLQTLQDKVNKDLFNKKDGGFRLGSILANTDAAKAREVLHKLLTNVQNLFNNTLDHEEQTVILGVSTNEETIIYTFACIRLLWQAGLEMGIDVESVFSQVTVESKEEVLILVHNIGSYQMRYKARCCDISFALSFFQKKF